ncbi:unnamed protein product [Clavelina lepadiformis]|uniref:Uncharacterized protein n=1 Tax=Clavelina lepadiformis TaxID=159417 RepID=A0ABP0F0U1_CLALP
MQNTAKIPAIWLFPYDRFDRTGTIADESDQFIQPTVSEMRRRSTKTNKVVLRNRYEQSILLLVTADFRKRRGLGKVLSNNFTSAHLRNMSLLLRFIAGCVVCRSQAANVEECPTTTWTCFTGYS